MKWLSFDEVALNAMFGVHSIFPYAQKEIDPFRLFFYCNIAGGHTATTGKLKKLVF